jgi:hypothetical protein
MPTFKVATMADATNYLNHFLPGMMAGLNFYGNFQWRRLRWRGYVEQQKAFDVICWDMGGDPNDRKVIAYGDGSFNHASRGRPAGPVKRMYREMRRRYGPYVRKVREYMTSQVCSMCDGWWGKNTRFYFVKTCKSVCLMHWNRDINAARNIRAILMHMERYGGERPEAFRG